MAVKDRYKTKQDLTNDYRLIYIIGVPNSIDYKGWLKIGQTKVKTLAQNNEPNSPAMLDEANRRGREFMTTSGWPSFKVYWTELAYNKNSGHFFEDHDVHKVLKRSGFRGKKYNIQEWYRISLKTAKRAIKAVKEGKKAISVNDYHNTNIVFRPEQEDIIEKTDKLFKKHTKRSRVMLWNAKMRFGKTLCALEVAKDMNYHHILIITHRPAVVEGWFKDFKKLLGNDKRYAYGSRDGNYGEDLDNLKDSHKRFFYFASLQDLVGSIYANGKFDKDAGVFHTNWNLLIIDEAHEGTQTKRAQNVIKSLNPEKRLLLSGTPFNLLNSHDYNNDQVCTWDYIDEQHAKIHWTDKPGHTKGNNPYGSLPTVKMYTFKMGPKFTQFQNTYDKSFNFDRFFSIRKDGSGRFEYEKYVRQFLRNITTPSSETNYPYSTQEYRDQIKHSLWILPSRASAAALKKLMAKDPVFMGFHVINIVDDNAESAEKDTERVESAIHKYRYTITLTVRKLTLGVTVPQWTAVVFLSDTSSPSQYLQSAFRAQTPYVTKDHRYRKTACYIFDFAPERALKMVTSTVQLDQVHRGAMVPKERRQKLTELLNFLPIVGETNNGMGQYDISDLLQALKQNYAEQAVNTGFATRELYNDRLLIKMPPKQLSLFDYVGKKAGFTKGQRTKSKIIINHNGLSQQEYKQLNKPNHTPTTQEQRKLNRAKQRRSRLIEILRSVSIRIPLMIYGMNVSFDKDIKIDDFTNDIDSKSWNEFMPNGITKDIFNQLTPYYDADVFIKAGKIIRSKVKAIDKSDPLTRTNKIANIFNHFHNPDKETVLTPWRVVNVHIGHTLGGYYHYKDSFPPVSQPKHQDKWLFNSNSAFYDPNVSFLEINSKTGLYPLYIATSLYYLAFNRMNNRTGGKFSYRDEMKLWYKILRKHLFIIAKTEMAKQIAIRTLIGYKRDGLSNLHIIYEKDLVKKAKDNPGKEVSNIEKRFNNMKFDVVIGNPPYQKNDKGAGASPIYQYFVNLSEKLSCHYVSLIIQARWFSGGKGLDKFRYKMLNDKHIKELYYFETPTDVFPRTEIKGGLAIFLWDKEYDNTNKGVKFVHILNNKVIGNAYRPLKTKGIDILITDNYAIGILQKIPYEKASLEQTVSTRKPFLLDSKFRKSKQFKQHSDGNSFYCYANANKKLIYGYVNKDEFLHKLNKNGKNLKAINQWKIFTPHINALGTEAPDDHFQTIIGKPGTICTETYMMIGYNLHLNKQSINNLAKYLKTKFSRYLLSITKSSHNAPKKVYRFIPMQDFTSNSDIDWSQSLHNIDEQLFNKYKLSDKQRKWINQSIKDQA